VAHFVEIDRMTLAIACVPISMAIFFKPVFNLEIYVWSSEQYRETSEWCEVNRPNLSVDTELTVSLVSNYKLNDFLGKMILTLKI
jgi:hypothetical protein